jgi:hypothetical protein
MFALVSLFFLFGSLSLQINFVVATFFFWGGLGDFVYKLSDFFRFVAFFC